MAAALAADPRLAAAAAVAGVGAPAAAVWRARYGGFAGVLAADAAYEALQEGDAVLIDMRCAAAWVACSRQRGKAWGALGAVLVHTAALRRGQERVHASVTEWALSSPVCKRVCCSAGDAAAAPCTKAASQDPRQARAWQLADHWRARGRPEIARARDGAPELRFGARGRGAAVPVQPLPASLARRVRDARRLEYDIAATVVAGLAKVG